MMIPTVSGTGHLGWKKVSLMAWLAGTVISVPDDWTNYRGPDYNGISKETNWEADWSHHRPKVLWRAEVGMGSSSIVTSAGHVFTMGNQGKEAEGQTDTVYCLDANNGKIVWTHSYACPRLPKYYEGGTLSTPTVDGDVVYTLSKMGDLFCLDAFTGRVVWQQQLSRDLEFKLPTWHFSGSPLVAADKLILNMGTAGAAFDKRTGALLWQNGKEPPGYATPVPTTLEGVDSVVICGADSILGVRISDGLLQWRYPFFNKHKANCGDAVVVGNEIFVSSAYGRGCSKIRIIENQATQVFDNTNMRNLQSSSIYWKGHLYGFDEALVKCIDFRDGSEKWRAGGLGKGSLSFSVDGRMLMMSHRGELVIAKANPETFDIIARAQILSKSICRTAPILSNGMLYLRNGYGNLACVDLRK